MSHLTQDQIQQLHEKLLSLQRDLNEKLKITQQESPSNDLERLDSNEASDDSREETKMLETEVLSEHLQNRLVSVERALERINSASYGLTTDGEPIPFARLLIDPTAETVIKPDAEL